MKYTTSFFFLVLFTLLFSACQKNEIEDLTLPDSEFIDDSSISPSTNRNNGNECQQRMLDIQSEFESIYYTSSLIKETFNANFGVPTWPKNNSYCDYFDIDSLVILPLVSLSGEKEIQSLLVIDKITREPEYSFTVIGKYQFSEVLDNINPDSIPESVTQLFEFFNFFTYEMSISNLSTDNAATIRCTGEGCGPSCWELFWSGFRRFVKRITSGGGGGGGSTPGNGGIYISPGTITFWNNSNPSPGNDIPPGGGSGIGNEPQLCSNEKDALTFEELELVLNNLSQYYDESGISSTNGTPLIEILQPGCAGLDYPEFRSCLNASILCSINENYDLSDDEASCIRNSPQISLDINGFLNSNVPNKNYIVNLYLRLTCEVSMDIPINPFAEIIYTDQNFENQETFNEMALSTLFPPDTPQNWPKLPLSLEICPSTFNNYTATGLGATIQLECNRFFQVNYNIITGAYDEICYDFPDMCIETGQFERIGGGVLEPIGGAATNTRKQLTAQAMHEAQLVVLNENLRLDSFSQPPLTQPQAFQKFKDALFVALNRRMTGVAVSSEPCNGNIGKARPSYDILGVYCAEVPCTCD